MRRTLRYLYWSSRILGILIILFLAIFALDVFIPGKTIDYYIIPLFMHLIPNFVLAGILFLAWRYEKIGGVLFLLIAVFFTFFFRTYTHLINFMLISFPIFLIGALFLLHNFLDVRRGSE